MSGSKEGGNTLTLVAALAANLGIAIAKFVAAGITGSSAMLTEGIHSVVDSLNQLLLLYGEKQAGRPPDARHPWGYGRELYFWAFVVAILIFAVGAGLSIYEGILHIIEPEPMESPVVNFVVLGISFLLEGVSCIIAIRQFGRVKGDQGWWEAVHRSKDPSSFIVLFEDSAALIGLVVAAIGVSASVLTGNPAWDGAASIVIGVVLAGVAIVLARESKELLIGERADPALVEAVRHSVDGYPEVTRVNAVNTVHIGPQAIFVGMSVDFEDHVSAGDIERLIARAEATLKARWPAIVAVYIKPEATVAEPAAG